MACPNSYLVQRHWHRTANTIQALKKPRFQRMVIWRLLLRDLGGFKTAPDPGDNGSRTVEEARQDYGDETPKQG